MNLRWLDDFLAICETRSFTDAARIRFLTQSALSKHMQALELWLGAGPLFDRSRSPLGITTAGQSFRNTASQAATLLNSARRFASSRKAITKDIYVSATHSLSSTFVPILSKLLCDDASEQAICLHVTANNFRDALLSYEQAESDYFLCYDSSAYGIPLEHHESVKLTLGTDYLVPVSVPATQSCKPYYALSRAFERPLPYLAYTDESHLGSVLKNYTPFAQLASRLTVRAESSYAETLRAGVLTGLGLAWLPYSLMRGNLEHGDVVLATTDELYYIPLTIDIYRQSNISRDEIIRCWEIWQAHIPSMKFLTSDIAGIVRPVEGVGTLRM